MRHEGRVMSDAKALEPFAECLRSFVGVQRTSPVTRQSHRRGNFLPAPEKIIDEASLEAGGVIRAIGAVLVARYIVTPGGTGHIQIAGLFLFFLVLEPYLVVEVLDRVAGEIKAQLQT